MHTVETQVLDSIFELFPSNGTPIGEEEVKDLISHLQYIEDFMDPSALIYILNYKTMSYEYLNSSFEKVIFDDLESAKKEGVKNFLEKCHPDDIQILSTQLLPDLMGAFHQLTISEKFKSKAQYNYRYKFKNGNYFNCLQKTTCIQIDPEGNPLLDIGFLNDLGDPEAIQDLTCTLSVMNNGTYERRFFKEYPINKYGDSTNQLTKRQLEITRQLASGKSTKEIADNLFLSLHTVNTHKRNIYKQLGINSVTQLISIAAKNNWL